MLTGNRAIALTGPHPESHPPRHQPRPGGSGSLHSSQEQPPSSPNQLTEAESEVVELAAQGLTNRAIARLRNTSEGTTANQLQEATRKLGAKNRAHAAVLYLQLQRLHP